MGNLLVSAVDSKGSLNKAVLEALEGFIKALASMPDAQQFSRYQTVLTWCWACQMHRHTAQASEGETRRLPRGGASVCNVCAVHACAIGHR